jgi:predicted O-methyltransferase YrrM
MSDFIIDTTNGMMRQENACRDPYDHLGPIEWVDKQLEFAERENFISGIGLIPAIKQLQGDLVGCEIGVCHGFTTEAFAKNIPNITKLYAIDNYPTYVDWDGTRITTERQAEIKRRCYERISKFPCIEISYDSSDEFHSKLEDNSLDFIFVDGDHSYEAAYRDFVNYLPKVKSGGVFAGHDIYLSSVQNAIRDALGEKAREVRTVENNAWYIIK